MKLFFFSQSTKSDLNETMINLEVNETLAANLERTTQDKMALEKQLKSSLQKEGLCHIFLLNYYDFNAVINKLGTAIII